MKAPQLCFALAAAAATLVAPAVQAAPATPAAQPVKVAVSVYGLKAEFMQLWVKAIKQHPAVVSGQATVDVFDGGYDSLIQNAQLNSAIGKKYDAIILIPIDAQAQAGAVTKAHAAGIPVVGSNSRVNSKLLTAYIGSDDVKAGEMEATAVAEKLGGKGNLVVLEGPIGHSAQIQRRKGIQNVLRQYRNLKLIEMKSANWTRPEGEALMRTWLTAHPNEIAGIIGENDEMALGSIRALKAANLAPSTLAVAGIDGVSDAINAVKAGEMASILQDANAQAQGALDLALRAKLGPSYQPQSSVWKQYADKMPWANGTAGTYNVPWTPVTSENADQLLAMRR